jgi:hypothetical protein
MFLKIREDIRKSVCITGVNYTGGKFATAITTLAVHFATSIAGVVETSGKFTTGVNVTGGKLLQVTTTTTTYMVANNRNNFRLLRT